MLTTGTDDPSLAGTWATIKVLGHGGYLVDSGLFLSSVSNNAVHDSK